MINDILSRATEGQPVPEVGMGATILMASDRHAATIVEVFGIGKATAVKVRRDIATVVRRLEELDVPVPRSMIDAVVADGVQRAGNRIVEHAPDGCATELSA